MTKKVALYCRVSTSTKDQTTENQRLELETYCDRMGYEVVKIGFVTLIRRSTWRTGGGGLCWQGDMLPRRNCRDAEQSVGPS